MGNCMYLGIFRLIRTYFSFTYSPNYPGRLREEVDVSKLEKTNPGVVMSGLGVFNTSGHLHIST